MEQAGLTCHRLLYAALGLLSEQLLIHTKKAHKNLIALLLAKLTIIKLKKQEQQYSTIQIRKTKLKKEAKNKHLDKDKHNSITLKRRDSIN